jgi:hypothetical protein
MTRRERWLVARDLAVLALGVLAIASAVIWIVMRLGGRS